MTLLPQLSPDEVRQRFEWAKKRGLRQWLWPDVEPQAWRNCIAQIARAAGLVLSRGQKATIPGDDPIAFSLACYTSGMGPLLGQWLRQGNLQAPDKLAAVLDLHLSNNATRLDRLRHHAVHVITLLSRAGVRGTLIKGMHTAFEYFPKPECRPLSDIDLVVPPEKLDRCEAILRAEGYVPELRHRVPYQCDWAPPDVARMPKSLLCVEADDPWAFDVQTTLDRHLAGGTIVRLDQLRRDVPDRPWSQSSAATVLGQPLLTLNLAVHASQVPVNLTLLRLVELALVVRKDTASRALSWPELENALRLIGPKFVFPAFKFCEELVPGTIPEATLELCRSDCPGRLLELLGSRTASTAAKIEAHSLGERYMWANGWLAALRQFGREFLPMSTDRSVRAVLERYYFRLRALRRLRR